MTQRCGPIAENAALLSLFPPSGILERKVTYQIPPERRDSAHPSKYVLSLKEETRCAQAFAILLADSIDPNRIGAVCIEQEPVGEGLTVRIASNSGPQSKRVDRLQRVADKLKHVSMTEDLSTQIYKMTGEMIAVLQNRLLSRLGSKHAEGCKRSPKKAILRKLESAMQLLDNTGCKSREYKVFCKFARSLVDKFNELEDLSREHAHSARGGESIHKILLTIKKTLKSVNISSILKPIPRNVDSWSGDSREMLVESLEKLVQHLAATRDLVRMAQKHAVVRSIKVQQLPNSTFPTSTRSAEPISVDKGFLRCCMPDENKTRRVKSLRRLELRWKKPAMVIKREAENRARESKKVHAEIQLLLYYEQRPEIENPPRVVCSSKYPCFLCDLFIKTHKRLHTPGSHGRCYPSWRLPMPEELNLPESSKLRYLQCLVDFNQELELQIQKLLRQNPTRKIAQPAESIIYNPGSITPSALSVKEQVGMGEHADIPEETDWDLQVLRTAETLKTPLPSEIAISPGAVASDPLARIQNQNALPNIGTAPFQTLTDSTDSVDCRSNVTVMETCTAHKSPERLYQMHYERPLTVVFSPGSSARFHTPRIHVELSYDDAISLASSDSRSTSSADTHESEIAVRIEWVHPSSCSAPETNFDLGVHWSRMYVDGDTLLGETRFALSKADEMLVISAK